MDDLLAILGHGASGTAASMRPWVDGLRAAGSKAVAIDLPRGSAERALSVFEAAIASGAGSPGVGRVVPGGHSFGGRVASLAVVRLLEEGSPSAGDPGGGARSPDGRAPDLDAERPTIAGLLLLSYPLHRPGDPDGWRVRTSHWPSLGCPVLVLSGESDPFARIGLLHEAVGLLPQGRLVTYPRVGHGLRPVFEDALAEAVAFLSALAPG